MTCLLMELNLVEIHTNMSSSISFPVELYKFSPECFVVYCYIKSKDDFSVDVARKELGIGKDKLISVLGELRLKGLVHYFPGKHSEIVVDNPFGETGGEIKTDIITNIKLVGKFKHKMVLCLLTSMADHEGYVVVKRRDVQSVCGLAKTTTQSILDFLKEGGFINYLPNGHSLVIRVL